MPEPISTINVDITHSKCSLNEIREYIRKYSCCDFTYYHSLCNKSDDYSERMFGQIIDKDGELILSFEEEDMQEHIKVDSELGRKILSMSEM